jgi:hypothetical protein
MSTTFKKEDGDLVLTSTGRIKSVQGAEKLAQEVGDMLLAAYDPGRGTGSDVVLMARKMSDPKLMPIFGEAFIARAVEDGLERLHAMQARDPKTTATERINPGKTKLEIRRPSKKEFLFYLTVAPEQGTTYLVPYRVRFRHQYPGRDARAIFPVTVTTDDMVP